MAVRRLFEDRSLLARVGKVGSLREKADRAAFEPDLLALFGAPSFEMGIVVRAPRDTAAKSIATVAGDLLADIALILLQHEAALVVLPLEAQRAAEATLAKWQQCARFAVRKSCKVYLLLLNNDREVLLRAPDPAEES
jgi:hypothetical protein